MNDSMPLVYIPHTMLIGISAVLVVSILYRRQFQHFSAVQMAVTTILVTGGASAMGLLAGFHFAMEMYLWQGWEISPNQRLDNLNEHFVTIMFVLDWIFVALLTWFFIFVQAEARQKQQALLRRR